MHWLYLAIAIAAEVIVGWVVYHQAMDLAALLGIALIVAGVVVLNVFSRAVPHG